MSRIFISYRRADSEGYVGRLYDHLCQHFQPEQLFMDIDAIPLGEDFMQVVQAAIQQCEVVLVVIGPQWLHIADEKGQRRLEHPQDFVRLEVQTALEQNKLLIPILVQGAAMPQHEELPAPLAPLSRRNALALSHRSFAYDVGQLVAALRQLRQQAAAPLSPEAQAKAARLKTLRDALVNMTQSPLYEFRTQHKYFPVLGEGNPNARIMLVGESPSHYDAEAGRPFVGPSGEVLDEMFAGINLAREHVYLTNILKDRTPQNRDPLPAEIECYAPLLDAQIEIIQPEVIVTLGRFAMQYLLRKYDAPEKRSTITRLHGKLIKVDAGYGEIHLIPMFHPAMVLYTASKRPILKQDFEKLRLFL